MGAEVEAGARYCTGDLWRTERASRLGKEGWMTGQRDWVEFQVGRGTIAGRLTFEPQWMEVQSGGKVWEEGWEITGCRAGMGGIVGSSRALNVCKLPQESKLLCMAAA